MLHDSVYYSASYSVKKKEKKVLFIFPELPCWIIGTSSLQGFLDHFKEGSTLSAFYIRNHITDEGEKAVYERLLNSLISKKILCAERYYTNECVQNHQNRINSFIFGITNRCNLRCSSCYNSYQWELDNELSIEEMKRMVDEVIPFLSYGFSISGGEPFCRKAELFELLEYVSLKAPNLNIGIVTNGTLITEDDVKRLAEVKNLTVQVSLDGITKEAHEFNRGKNTFEKVITSLKELRRYDVNVLLGVLLTEKSIKEVKDVLDFAIELGISNVRFIEMFWQGLSRSKAMKRPLSYELFPILRSLLKNDEKYKTVLQQDTTKIIFDSLINPVKRKCCGIDNRTVYIDSDGSVYPCNLLLDKKYLLGNIRERKFSAIWLHAQIKEELRELSVDQFPKCKECEIRYLCGGGCRGTAFNANKDILSPPPNCYEKKETIYSYLWEFAEQDSIYSLLK